MVESWDFDPSEKIEIVKICQNPSIQLKLCLLLSVLTIIDTSPYLSLFRKVIIAAKRAVLSYELLKFGRNHI